MVGMVVRVKGDLTLIYLALLYYGDYSYSIIYW